MIPENTKAEVIAEYLIGVLSIAKLAKKYEVSERSITLWLRKSGIEIKKTNGRELNLDAKEINDLYTSGYSTYEISKMKSCSDETVRKLIINIRPAQIRNIHTEETKSKISNSSKLLWQDQLYKEKVAKGTSTEEYRKRLSESSRKHSTLSKWVKTEAARKTISESVKERWKTEKYRKIQERHYQDRIERLRKSSAIFFANPESKLAWKEKLKVSSVANREKPGYVSMPQKMLYDSLQISNIEYYPEGPQTRISPFYVVDCIIPIQQNMTKPLIIEVQGEYWHSLERVIIKDTQKKTYISKHTDYDLLYLTDLEVKSYDEVKNKISKYGLLFKTEEAKVSQLTLSELKEQEAEDFICKYHYLSSVRRGSVYHGVYYNNDLVWVIGYSCPIRTEVARKQNIQPNQILEISRIARKPNFICKNLASHMISKSKALLPPEIKMIISYADSTEGHTGTVYKASGFKYDGDVKPDYHYISELGRYHKKTIWDRAKKFKMSESDYALKDGLTKVKTKSKSRWVLKING